MQPHVQGWGAGPRIKRFPARGARRLLKLFCVYRENTARPLREDTEEPQSVGFCNVGCSVNSATVEPRAALAKPGSN